MYYSDPKPGLIAQVDGDIVLATRQDTFGPTPHSEIAVTPARADAATVEGISGTLTSTQLSY